LWSRWRQIIAPINALAIRDLQLFAPPNAQLKAPSLLSEAKEARCYGLQKG
jgi:hypothetical protein